MLTTERLIQTLDRVNITVGRYIRWFALAMVLLQVTIVVFRYVFGISFVFMNETVLYLHAGLFMLGAGYTLLHDRHVRVDIFYAQLGKRQKSIINMAGYLLFLLPSMTVLLIYSWPSVWRSWSILEGPISVGGIPASFLLKSLIPLFCLLLIIQGCANLLREYLVLRQSA
jgi:TRAP-type mannitol/chloroaromatic compound transport system permease small subunit